MGVLLFLIKIIVSLFFAVHLVAYAIRWVEEGRRNRDERSIFDAPFSGVVDIAKELLSSGAIALLSVWDLILQVRHFHWWMRKPTAEKGGKVTPPQSPPYEGPRPIILLHGAAMRGLGMYPLARKLRRTNRSVHMFTYWPPGRDIGDYANQFKDYLEGLCQKNGYREFDAVGHSMGGLVLRRYLALHPEGPAIKHLVTIGTPHGGSELWRFTPTTSGRQLRPGGEFLKHLDEAGLPNGVEATAISADFDQLVIPNTAARWEAQGVVNHTVSRSGHARLIFHPDTYAIILDALELN